MRLLRISSSPGSPRTPPASSKRKMSFLGAMMSFPKCFCLPLALMALTLIRTTSTLQCLNCMDESCDSPNTTTKQNCTIPGSKCWSVSTADKSQIQVRGCIAMNFLDHAEAKVGKCRNAKGQRMREIIQAFNDANDKSKVDELRKSMMGFPDNMEDGSVTIPPSADSGEGDKQESESDQDQERDISEDEGGDGGGEGGGHGRWLANSADTYEVCACDKDLCNDSKGRKRFHKKFAERHEGKDRENHEEHHNEAGRLSKFDVVLRSLVAVVVFMGRQMSGS